MFLNQRFWALLIREYFIMSQIFTKGTKLTEVLILRVSYYDVIINAESAFLFYHCHAVIIVIALTLAPN